MGEIGENLQGNLIIKSADGNEVLLENVTISEISAEPIEEEILNPRNTFRETRVVGYNHKVSITLNRPTKKKFIKMLMGKGIARNGAKDIASYVYKKYGFYNEMFLMFI